MKDKLMNRTHLICYADHQMETSQRLCMRSAVEKAGIRYAHDYNPDFIQSDTDFVDRNARIWFAEQRGGGFGYWLFKPYICEYATRSTPTGDYVIYADAGVEFINPLEPLIEKMERTKQEILLFGNGHPHVIWCKKKVLEAMVPEWYRIPDIITTEQVQASVIIFKISEFTKLFMRQWLAWSEIPGFIDDSDNVGAPGVEEHYQDHRNDQSILTNLAINWGIPLHWWPVQYGHSLRPKYPYDAYPQLFYHHRFREEHWQQAGTTIEQFMALPKNQ